MTPLVTTLEGATALDVVLAVFALLLAAFVGMAFWYFIYQAARTPRAPHKRHDGKRPTA